MEKGLFVVVSGPSGAGKGTVCEKLIRRNSMLFYSISVTTRLPRKDEENGVNYHFVSVEEFNRLKEEGALMEWAEIYGNYYGTPLHAVKEKISQGYDVILEIDVQGAAQVRQNFREGISIFLLPPSIEDLRRRILKRGTETTESMEKRLSSALKEMQEVWNYDYVVVNKDINLSVERIESIIKVEKYRVDRNHTFLCNFFQKEGGDALSFY